MSSLFGFGNNNHTCRRDSFGDKSKNTNIIFGVQKQNSNGVIIEVNNHNSSGGLFGAPKQENIGSGGLFGAPKQENIGSGGLFGAPKQENIGSVGLFGAPKQETECSGGLFGAPKQETIGSCGLFGAPKQETEGTGGLFAPLINDNQKPDIELNRNTSNNINTNNNNLFGLLENNNEVIHQEKNSSKIPRNNLKNFISKSLKKCIHEKDFIAYNIKNGLLLCYNCLYKYYKNDIQNCIPIKENNFENYKKFYKDYINKYKLNLKKIFKEIISKIEIYENEEIENISTLFNDKVNLKFELPIEIPFIERFEIAINRKINSLLKEKIFLNWKINYNCINLFENELKELKFKKNNPNEKEIIKIRSSINFNLSGIALPKITEDEGNEIEINLTSNNSILSKITTFENYNNYENLSIGLFENIIEIKKNTDYFIEIIGIKNLDYICNDEEYNENTKLEISSNKKETILAALFIE